ncbi:transcription antitermination factor NusB [Spiroplasma clarkii]|uniref:transcription antitermination factor NusB n=1 Tax=Spiroplasma clarkii TaxID=2139 RepID=UPI0011BAE131|nr:transcription antitermination factor NusB [Spiroplasma clarkii]
METRLTALKLLCEVFLHQKFANKLLNQLKQSQKFSDPDIAFIFKLVYGTIQYKIYLEYVVNKIIDPQKTDKEVQILLWMSLYQIKFLNTPIYSVTFEGVEVVKKINKQLAGFVNVKIKALADSKLWEVNIKNKQNTLALENGFPFWLYQHFKADFGQEIAEKLVLSANQPTLISFRLNLNKISQQDFLAEFQVAHKIEVSKIAKNAYLAASSIFTSRAFVDKLIYIQDETSILAVELLNPQPNTKVLDLCCAPGGKLSYLAQLVGPKTIVTGNEIDVKKQNLIEQNLNACQITNVKLSFLDGRQVKGNFDYIMLDAPCSGWGVFKRKPEIKLKNLHMKQCKVCTRLRLNF